MPPPPDPKAMRGKLRHHRPLQEKLRRIAEDIKKHHAKVGGAQKAAVEFALATGQKLAKAAVLLRKLRTHRKHEGQPPPPTWAQWVADSCDITVRTAERYVRLHSHRREIEPLLNSPDVSIRRLLRVIARGFDLTDEATEARATAAAPDTATIAAERDKSRTLHEHAKKVLRSWFSEELNRWRPEMVVYVSGDPDEELADALRSLRGKVRRLAQLCEGSMDVRVKDWPDGPAWRMILKRLWSQLKHRQDATPYEKGKIIRWLRWADWLKLDDRRVLRRWYRELNGPDAELRFAHSGRSE